MTASSKSLHVRVKPCSTELESAPELPLMLSTYQLHSLHAHLAKLQGNAMDMLQSLAESTTLLLTCDKLYAGYSHIAVGVKRKHTGRGLLN